MIKKLIFEIKKFKINLRYNMWFIKQALLAVFLLSFMLDIVLFFASDHTRILAKYLFMFATAPSICILILVYNK